MLLDRTPLTNKSFRMSNETWLVNASAPQDNRLYVGVPLLGARVRHPGSKPPRIDPSKRNLAVTALPSKRSGRGDVHDALKDGGVDSGRVTSHGDTPSKRGEAGGSSCCARPGRREEKQWCATDSLSVNGNVTKCTGAQHERRQEG